MNNYWTRIGQGITHFFSWAYNNHPGKLTGISLGFLVGLFFVTLGFWRTLILFIFIAVGYILGKSQDDHKSLSLWLERLLK
ncbi:MAG TPA: DUF2273 domain-containing protein [Desulfitobacteriaceae bacterium]|jgi:uncharacterized membrane protein|nr:DUF2273 domain-containing protein [Desulfitobacteriaceae bacterium]